MPTSPAFQFARVHQFNADLFPLYTHVLALLKSDRSQLALRRSASLSSRISQMGCVRVHFVGALLGAPLPVFVSFDRVRFWLSSGTVCIKGSCTIDSPLWLVGR